MSRTSTNWIFLAAQYRGVSLRRNEGKNLVIDVILQNGDNQLQRFIL